MPAEKRIAVVSPKGINDENLTLLNRARKRSNKSAETEELIKFESAKPGTPKE